MTALEATGLVKRYGELVALDALDLEVARGELVVLIGHNGSGKSTLLNLAAGLLEPSAGTIAVAGQPAGSIAARAALSYLPDTPVLYSDLSLVEHLEYVARLHGVVEWRARADDLVDRLGLAPRADDLPTRFSRGLRQKASIALAFVRPFAVLLVDEPFVGLDALGREALLALVGEAREDGATVVVATHQLDVAARAERCVALRDGRVVHDGRAGEAEVARLVTAELDGA